MTTSIRKVQDADLSALVKIDSSLFGAESFPPFSMRQFINLCSESFFVAEKDGGMVGYAIVGIKPSSHDAWLLSLGVLKAHQNCGIGTNLLRACDEFCKISGINACRLTTDPDNTGAIKLYERFGFQKASEVRNYYESGDRKVMMIKRYTRSSSAGAPLR